MRRFCLALACATAAAGMSSGAEPDDWPQWRGPDRDGHSHSFGLKASWSEDGPPVVWKVDGLGEAYSTVSVAEGRVYTQGNVDGAGRIHCLDEANGQTLWSVAHPAEKELYTHGRGNGARGAPVVDGNRVYAESGGGAVACLKTEDGEPVWSLHLVEDLGGRRPGWGYSESPLVDGDRLIVTPGGEDGTVAALDKHTGEVLWRSTGVTDGAQYCSPIAADVQGVRQIVQFTDERIVGLDAGSGRLLWDYASSANGTANICTPVYHDDRVFSSSAYGTGGGLVKLTRQGDAFEAEEVYFERRMANHHGGLVLVDGYLYGFGGSILTCLDFETGEIAWRDRSVGKGSLCYADGHLYCLSERNTVGLVQASPDGYVEKGRFEVPESGRPSWAHPVVAGGRLYIRDQDTVICYGIRAAD